MITESSRDLLEDRLAIIELTSRYAYLVDTFNLDGLMELWIDDDPVFDEEPVGLKKNIGKDGIRHYFQNDIFGKMDAIVHLTTNHIIDEITATTATGVCTVLVEGDVKGGGGTIRATAYYEDNYVCEDGTWKFRSRKVTPFTKPQLGSYFQ